MCQNADSQFGIVKPFEKKGYDPSKPEQISYHTVAKYLIRFRNVNGLPPSLQQRTQPYQTNDDLTAAFILNKSVYHKSCQNKFNKTKLTRIQNKRTQETTPDKNENSNMGTISEIRQSAKAKNFIQACFFCDKADDSRNLHSCQTLCLDTRIRKLACEMYDTKLMSKLSEGYMIAIEAKYHLNCLNEFNNKYRSFNSKSTKLVEVDLIKGIAMSDVINCIETNLQSIEHIPVFKLKDLKNMYIERMITNGASEEEANRIHSTRFKDAMIEKVPGLCESTNGVNILLTLDGEMGKALFEACKRSNQDDGAVLAKAAQIICRYLFATEEIFDGDISDAKQRAAVPSVLMHLIEMIIEGSSSKSSSTKRIANNISQLIRFNSVRHSKRTDTISHRHSKKNEPPLPIAIGMMIHARTRSKNIVEDLAHKGLGISYTRLCEIQDCLTTQLCQSYNTENIVCPSSLKKGFFTTAAIDNIDYNPSSTTAKSSFHGTTISLFQQRKNHEIYEEEKFYLDPATTANRLSCLPLSYTDIKPTPFCIVGAPLCADASSDAFYKDTSTKKEAEAWLEKLGKFKEELSEMDRVSFAGYYSLECPIKTSQTTNVLLPLLLDSVSSPAMVSHCMTLVQSLTEKINQLQHSVITGDQPVYALGKQVQWMFPDKFKNMLWMMGPLHIEMAFLDIICDWVEDSGWTDALVHGDFSAAGRSDNFLTGRKVKRSRYAHEVSLAVLQKSAMDVYCKEMNNNNNSVQDNIISFADWAIKKSQTSINANYWFQVMELETLLFMLVKSLREANFHLFCKTLKTILSWVFALDHYNYSRWLSVFMRDLERLPEEHNDLLQSFRDGPFTGKTFFKHCN